jgi:hypothetical protein
MDDLVNYWRVTIPFTSGFGIGDPVGVLRHHSQPLSTLLFQQCANSLNRQTVISLGFVLLCEMVPIGSCEQIRIRLHKPDLL